MKEYTVGGKTWVPAFHSAIISVNSTKHIGQGGSVVICGSQFSVLEVVSDTEIIIGPAQRVKR